MLENILNEINKNLEKIAKALEINANLVVTTEARSADTAKINADLVAHAIPVPQETTFVPLNTTVTPAIPTAQPQGFTQEQLAVAMSNAVATGKSEIVMNTLKAFNVQALTQVNPADYNKLATMLQEAGVKI